MLKVILPSNIQYNDDTRHCGFSIRAEPALPWLPLMLVQIDHIMLVLCSARNLMVSIGSVAAVAVPTLCTQKHHLVRTGTPNFSAQPGGQQKRPKPKLQNPLPVPRRGT